MHHAVKNQHVCTSIRCLSIAPDHHLFKMQCEAAIFDLDNPTTHAMSKCVSSIISTYIDDEMLSMQHAPRTPILYFNYFQSIHVQIMQCEASSSTTINDPAIRAIYEQSFSRRNS